MATELKRLKERHKVIVDRVIEGKNNKEIALELGRNEQAIGQVIASSLMQAEIARRREEMETAHDQGVGTIALRAREKIEGAAEMAADTMIGLMTVEDPSIRHRSAADILDRVYGKAGDRGGDKRPTVVIAGDMLINLQTALREAQGPLGEIIVSNRDQ